MKLVFPQKWFASIMVSVVTIGTCDVICWSLDHRDKVGFTQYREVPNSVYACLYTDLYSDNINSLITTVELLFVHKVSASNDIRHNHNK